MGYVEDIQKINKMARELLQHGMATSLDEAVNKAKSMLKNDLNLSSIPSTNHPKENNHEIKVEEAGHNEVKDMDNTDVDKRSGMSWQQAMKVNNEYMVGLLKQYGEQLNVFKQNITDLHKEIVALKESQKIMNVVKQENSQQTLQQGQQSRPEPSKPKPRSGDYRAEDVSIEKMFYCGSK